MPYQIKLMIRFPGHLHVNKRIVSVAHISTSPQPSTIKITLYKFGCLSKIEKGYGLPQHLIQTSHLAGSDQDQHDHKYQ